MPYLLTFLFAVALTALVGGLETVITALVIPLVDGLKSGAEGLTVSGQAGGISRFIRGLFPAGSAYWPALEKGTTPQLKWGDFGCGARNHCTKYGAGCLRLRWTVT